MDGISVTSLTSQLPLGMRFLSIFNKGTITFTECLLPLQVFLRDFVFSSQ